MIVMLQLIGGLAILLVGGEALVRGAAQLATRFGLSRMIVGMVVVGFGTSLPELVVSVRAVLADAPGLAVGNVVGSNISNILLIIAIAALVRPIDAARRGLEPEAVVLMVVTIAVMLLCLQGTVPRWQGGLLVVVLFSLVVLKVRQDRTAERRRRATEPLVETVSPFPAAGWSTFACISLGLVALPVGGEFFVRGAAEFATRIGVSNALIGLTVVAVGTSLPELATSAMAAFRGESTIGYGNIVGSNIFNLLGIFGCASLVGEMVVPSTIVYVDGIVMIAATAAMLWFITSHARLTRGEAAIMLSAYIGYVALRYTFALS